MAPFFLVLSRKQPMTHIHWYLRNYDKSPIDPFWYDGQRKLNSWFFIGVINYNYNTTTQIDLRVNRILICPYGQNEKLKL